MTEPLRPSLPGMRWPAILTGPAAQLLALQHEFDQSQWWPEAKLRQHQFEQLGSLLAHAAETIPFYAARLRNAGLAAGGPLTPEAWARLPILTRREVQGHEAELHAKVYPKEFGPVAISASGGSTGVPVRVRKTALDGLLWNVNQIRSEFWHRETFTGHIARLRNYYPDSFTPDQVALMQGPEGLRLPNWGPPCSLLWDTGPLTMIDSRRPIEEQVDFLQRVQPDYIQTHPNTLQLLIRHCLNVGTRLPSVRAVWTLSERVDDSLREACHEVLGAKIVNDYTTGETGYVALQCPEHTHFHVLSETNLVEVLDDNNAPCRPGEIGRVIITPLHNYAMPLLRYEIGDLAEMGPACPCGRGLPVLNTIVGRSNDLLTLPDGGVRRTDLRHYSLAKITAILEYQIVQVQLDRIEVRMVVARPLTAKEEAGIRTLAADEFGPEFRIGLVYRSSLPRTPLGKLRTFLSELPAAKA